MFGLRNTTVSLDSIRKSADRKKVLLLSPWADFRRVFFTRQSTLQEQGLIYYITPGYIESFRELIVDISHQINTAFPAFGKHTEAITNAASDTASGKAFAQALNSINAPIMLFIDEISPTIFNENTPAVTSLIQSLGHQVQLIFSSRLLSYQPWQQWLSDGNAAVLKIERHQGELGFVQETVHTPQIEVFGFGPGTAFIDGLEVTQWEGMLPRTLFFYLIDHPIASRDDIFRDFWPQPRVAVKDATDIFHVTKHKVSEVLNKRLGIPNVLELTAYKQGVYIPGERLVRHYDVALFVDLLHQAARNEQQRETMLEHAVNLYKGPFLSALEAQWIVQRRHELEILYSEALIELARISNTRGDHDLALMRFREALGYRPEREDIHREIILLLAQAGHLDKAADQLSQLIETLYTPLGISITPETKQVMAKYNLTT